MPDKLFEKNITALIILGIFVLGVSLLHDPRGDINKDNLFGYFLNVGQGDAILLSRQDKQVLIDGGPDGRVVAEIDKVMPPFDRTIESIILTHPHSDHLNGLIYVLDRYKVEKIYLTGQNYDSPEYSVFLEKIKEKSIRVLKAEAGASFEVDGITAKFLWPVGDEFDLEDLNSGSIVTDIIFQETHWLLLGDLPEKYQDQIEVKSIPKSDLIKVAHHGSKNGISSSLLNGANPEFAIISVGLNNSYGHPSKATLSKLALFNILRTDKLGSIRMTSDGKNTSLLR